MALAFATITGTYYLPDGEQRRELKVEVRAEAPEGTVRSSAESAILSGAFTASTLFGVLTITLPLSGGLVPEGTRWRASFTSLDQDEPPPSMTFKLTGNTNWAALTPVGIDTLVEIGAGVVLLEDSVGSGFYSTTGLPEDPGTPGMYFPDGLVEDPAAAPGLYLIGA